MSQSTEKVVQNQEKNLADQIIAHLKITISDTVTKLPQLLNIPYVLPKEIQDKIVKGIKDFSTNLYVDIFTGIAFNVAISRFSPVFRSMDYKKRLPIRLGLFFLPFGGDYGLHTQFPQLWIKAQQTTTSKEKIA